MGFDWKSVIGTIAPTIATALGGPLAGNAVSAIGKAIGLSDDDSKDESAVEKAIQSLTPEQIVELKKADAAFKAKMKELDIDLARINMQDRDSARDREKSTGDIQTPRWLTFGALIVFFSLILIVAVLILVYVYTDKQNTLPSELWMLLSSLVGLSGGFVSQGISYYLGSNSGSEARDKMIYENTPAEAKLLEAAASRLSTSK